MSTTETTMSIGQIQERIAADTGRDGAAPALAHLGAILLHRSTAARQMVSFIADLRDQLDDLERRLERGIGGMAGLTPHNISASGAATAATSVRALDEAYGHAARALRENR